MTPPTAQEMPGKESMAGRDANTAEKSPREPSMEDILASIRQIIAGDQQLPLSSRSWILPPLVRPTTAPPAMFPLRATLQASARAPVQVVPANEPPVAAVGREPDADFADIADTLCDPQIEEETPYQAAGPFLFAHAE